MRNEVVFVLPTSWKPNKDEFLSVLGISRGGLGEYFFGGVFDALFVSSIKAKDEFQKYYSVEYANLTEYLDIRYGITLSEDYLEADQVYLVTWLPQVINSSTYDDNKLGTVLECIKKLEEAQNED